MRGDVVAVLALNLLPPLSFRPVLVNRHDVQAVPHRNRVPETRQIEQDETGNGNVQEVARVVPEQVVHLLDPLHPLGRQEGRNCVPFAVAVVDVDAGVDTIIIVRFVLGCLAKVVVVYGKTGDGAVLGRRALPDDRFRNQSE
jgi:hypothetical protein